MQLHHRVIGRDQIRAVNLDLVIVLCAGGNECGDGHEYSEDDQHASLEPSNMHACSAATPMPRLTDDAWMSNAVQAPAANSLLAGTYWRMRVSNLLRHACPRGANFHGILDGRRRSVRSTNQRHSAD